MLRMLKRTIIIRDDSLSTIFWLIDKNISTILTLNGLIATKVICYYRLLKCFYDNSVDPDQTAPLGAVCSGSTLFASILNSSVMLGNYLQQTSTADDIFRCFFFLVL